MRFVIIGAGSIGQRHLRNLLGLGHQVVAVADPSQTKLEEIRRLAAVPVVTNDEAEALEQDADAALICSPTAFHLAHASMAIERKLHVFVEKPLSHTLEGTGSLIAKVSAAGGVALVACNLRFLPSLRLVKRLLDDGRMGKPLGVRAQCGYYFPYWRAHPDYHNNYGAKVATGGGIILDSIHEFDYLHWLLGEVAEVFCYAGTVSKLEIETEDNADILLRFASGVVANVHLDYLQRTYRRSCEIISEEGVIVWDYISQTVSVYGKEDRHLEVFLESINTERNQMFIDEMEHFVACIEGREQPAADTATGRAVLQIALAAKSSAAEGKVIRIGR